MRVEWVILMALAIGWSNKAWAEDEAGRIHVGTLEIRPATTLSAVYDDNVFKVNRNNGFGVEPARDIYFTLYPRLGLRWPFGWRSFVSAGYGWQAVKYTGGFGDSPNTTIWDTFNTHTLFGELSLRFNSGWGLDVRNDFERKSLFVTATDLAVNVTADLKPVGLRHNEFKPTALYSIPDGNLQFDVGYLLSTDNFVQRSFDYLDKNVHAPLGKVSYRIFPKTAVFVEGEGYYVRYVRPGMAGLVAKANADGWKAWAGLQGSITLNLNAILAAGWGRLDYDRRGLSENANTWLAKAEANEKFSERTRLTLGLSREFYDSYSTNFYTSSRGYAEVWRSLTPSAALVAGGNVFRNRYSQPLARLDRGYLASLKVEMRPLTREWLKFGLGYNREHRDSDFHWFTYRSNQVFTEVEAAL